MFKYNNHFAESVQHDVNNTRLEKKRILQITTQLRMCVQKLKQDN